MRKKSKQKKKKEVKKKKPKKSLGKKLLEKNKQIEKDLDAVFKKAKRSTYFDDIDKEKIVSQKNVKKLSLFMAKYRKKSPRFWYKRILFWIIRRSYWITECQHKKHFYKLHKKPDGIYRTTICKNCCMILKEKEFFSINEI